VKFAFLRRLGGIHSTLAAQMMTWMN